MMVPRVINMSTTSTFNHTDLYCILVTGARIMNAIYEAFYGGHAAPTPQLQAAASAAG